MLLVHEVHRVQGARDHEFEAAYRDEFLPALAATDDARLLYYLHHVHGTGPAYTVITVTAAADAAAWERLAERMRRGDLRGWAGRVDGMRHESGAKVLRPVEWSPLQHLDLGDVPVDGRERDHSLFMEDTAWPFAGGLDRYLEAAGSLYVATLERSAAAGRSLLALEAAFQTAWGSSSTREVVLWQRVVRPELLVGLFSREVAAEHRAPGTWMHDALAVRDRWESRLLRTAAWSPLA